MNIAAICFTHNGAKLCECLSRKALEHQWHLASAKAGLDLHYADSLKLWTQNAFESADAIVFVGACGIAVRSIAPYIQHKTKDPAVLVIDESGKFVISLLAGHIGGANQLAKQFAEYLGATPVITTATDQHRLLAVDSFAKQNNLAISDMNIAKYISVAMLEGKKIGLYSQFSFFQLPNELIHHSDTKTTMQDLGIAITIYENQKPFKKTLVLVPRIVHIGIGCRKNVTLEAIENFVIAHIAEKGISLDAIKGVASISLKANEKGLIAFCQKYNWTFETYSSASLEMIEGEFTASAFVKKQIGVDNVCERAAVLAAGDGGSLLEKKIAENGITMALAIQKWGIDFAK